MDLDLGDILGNIMYSAIFILGFAYIFYLIVKIAVKHVILSLSPKIKENLKEKR